MLGLLQGPAELLPVSSSGHLVLVPRLLGWPYAGLEPEARKSFEVAVHAGSAAALAILLRDELRSLARPREAALLALTFAPAAVAGLAFEGPIERRLGTVRGVAAAQVAAGAWLAMADRTPVRRRAPGPADHLAAGLAQAAALAPGVSRGGAILTVARLRGLARPAAARLSLRAALPVSVGAAALKTVRAARGGLPPGLGGPFAVAAGAAFASTLCARGLAARLERARSYLPLAAYRVALGAAALALARDRTYSGSAEDTT